MSPSLLEVVADLQRRITEGAQRVELVALDPDLGRGKYAGEVVEVAGVMHVHRPYRVWVDLAERLGLRMLTPERGAAGTVVLRFERLDAAARWQTAGLEASERYGRDSGFQRISKLEDPDLVLDFADALVRCQLPASPTILDLGVNRGDTFALLIGLYPELAQRATFVGVDHSASALALARARFTGDNFRFVEADLNVLPEDLGCFDLVVSMGTLQSPGVDDREVLRRLVQRELAPAGALILGVPNCRYIDGERVHGARQKNFSQPELGLVIHDIAYFKRYLQQHRRQVYVTGRDYLLVTAVVSERSGVGDGRGDDRARSR